MIYCAFILIHFSHVFCHLNLTFFIFKKLFFIQIFVQPIKRSSQIKSQELVILGNTLADLTKLSTLTLNLSDNEVDQQGISGLCSPLSKCTQLSTLSIDLVGNSIDNQIAQSLISAIAKCTNLSKLSLYLNVNQIGDLKGLDLFCILTNCSNLSILRLQLSKNQIRDQDVQILGNALVNQNMLSNLTLDLSQNKIEQAGAQFLGSALAKCKNLSVLDLNLSMSKLGDLGIIGLGIALTNMTNIQVLTLWLYNNSIGPEGVSILSKSLANLLLLQNLTIWFQNNSIKSKGLSSLVSHLSSCINLSILALWFDYCQIDDDGASNLAAALQEYSNMSKLILYLSSNKIGDMGAQNLCSALKKCMKLQNLSFDIRSRVIKKEQAQKKSSKQIKQVLQTEIRSLKKKMILENIQNQFFNILKILVDKISTLDRQEINSEFIYKLLQTQANSDQMISLHFQSCNNKDLFFKQIQSSGMLNNLKLILQFMLLISQQKVNLNKLAERIPHFTKIQLCKIDLDLPFVHSRINIIQAKHLNIRQCEATAVQLKLSLPYQNCYSSSYQKIEDQCQKIEFLKMEKNMNLSHYILKENIKQNVFISLNHQNRNYFLKAARQVNIKIVSTTDLQFSFDQQQPFKKDNHTKLINLQNKNMINKLSQPKLNKLKNAVLIGQKARIKQIMQKENAICNQMKYQLLGGSKNLKEANYKEQQNYHEQDIIDSYEQTINKKNRQEISSLINANLEENKIQVEFNETQYDEQNYSNTQQGEFGKLDKELNQLLQILCDKYLEIQKKQNQSLKMEKQKIQVEQKTEQPESTTIISQQSQTTSQLSDFQGICLSNQNSFSYFGQQGVKRFETIKEILESQQKNEKIQKNFSNKLQKNIDAYSEQFLRQIFQLGDHINSGGEADIFTHAYDESIAYRVIKLDEDEDLNEQLLELYSIKELQEQNILDLNTSHLVEDKDNDTKYIIHVMQKCQMSLQDEISSKKVFSLREILRFISTAFHLLIVLRQKYIYHSDIKPGNILKIDDNNYKLSDFGASQLVNFIDPFCDFKMYTPGFIPQNQSLDLPFYHDIYSFGKTIQKLLMQLENQSEISDCLNKFIDEEICKDDKNSINLDCFELPRKFINILMNFVNYEVIEAFLEEYLKQIEQYLVIKKENKIFQYESEYQYAEIAILIISYLRQDQTSIKIKALITKSYILCKRKQYEESLKCFNEIFRENFKDDSQSEILIKSITIVSKILIKLNNKTNLSQENQIKLIDLIKLANSDEMFDKLKIKIIELLLLKSSDIYPIIRDFYDSLKKQDENQELNMVYRIITKFIRFSPDIIYHFNTEIDTMMFYIDLFMKAKTLNNITKLTLDFSEYLINMGNNLAYIFESLQMCQKITELNLNFENDSEIDDDGAFIIAQTILRKSQDLVKLSLNLSKNQVKIEGVMSIANALENCQKLTSLELLLNDNFIGNEVTQQIENIIQKCQNLMELSLGLKCNLISDEGIYSIASALNMCQNIAKLSLNLSLNNIEIEGAMILASAFENCLKLTQLEVNLNKNYIGNDVTNCVLVIMQTCQNLTHLNLGLNDNFITDEGVQNIANAYTNSKNITEFRLYLNKNNITLKGASILTKALESNKNIQWLTFDLNGNCIEYEELHNLYQTFRQNMKNKMFNFQGNNSEEVEKLQEKYEVTQIVDYVKKNLSYQMNEKPQKYLDQNEKTTQLNITSSFEQTSNTNDFRSPNQLKMITLSEIYINWQTVFTTTAQNIAQYLLTKQQSQFDLNLFVQGSQLFSEDQCFKNCEQINKYVYFHGLSLMQNKQSQQIKDIEQKQDHEMEQLDLYLDFNIISSEAAQVIKNMLQQYKSNIKLNHQFNSYKNFDYETIMSALDKSAITLKIDLCQQGKSILNEGAQKIANTLAKCQNTTKLNLCLSECSIIDEATKIIAYNLRNCKNITELSLNLSSNKIGIQGAKYISDAIKHFRKAIQLDIDLNQNDIKEEGAQCIADALQNCQNITIFNLSLRKNKIGAESIKNIANSLEMFKKLSQVSLDLSQNKIGIDGTHYISRALINCYNVNQLSINLGENDIKDEGAKFIASALEKCENLADLKLSLKENHISSEGAKNILNALKSCNKITGLNIDFENNQIDGEGFNSVINSIFKCQKITHTSLNFNNNKIDVNVSLNVQNNDENSHNITQFSLDLGNNKISLEQAQNITNFLKKCKNLQKLNLNLKQDILNNAFGDDQIQIIANFLQNCQSLTEITLNLKNNKISAEGAKNIANALTKLQNLTLLNLDLCQNKIISEGIISITNALQQCQKISKLNLSFGQYFQESDLVNVFADSLANSENISELDLEFSANLNSQNAKNIYKVLEKCQNVTQLSLKFHYFKNLNNDTNLIPLPDNIQNLSGQLEKLQNITRLELSFLNADIGDEGAYYISRAFEKCQNITQLKLDFRFTQIEAKGVQEISSAIEKCQKITNLALNLSMNNIQDEGVLSISNTLEKCQNITELFLNLEQNRLSQKAINNLIMALERSQNITKLQFHFLDFSICFK